ncbi:MAG: winged helix-turn-helix transcriptional regulator [Rhodospirillales bacterium]|nr:winged helix-turn-helix transcriptional regulator [Rhodospirillales bacterium]
MVKYLPSHLDSTFAALADPTRRAILARLTLGEASVGEIAEPFAMSLPAVSKHLKVLETAGLLKRERDGRVLRCRLDAAPIAGIASWIEDFRRFWHGQFDRLDEFLKAIPTEETHHGPERRKHPRRNERD